MRKIGLKLELKIAIFNGTFRYALFFLHVNSVYYKMKYMYKDS